MRRVCYFLSGCLWAALFSMPVLAETISIRGINWTMPEAEQIALLESEGLTCVKQAGWDELFPTTSQVAVLVPLVTCVAGSENQEDVKRLQENFAQNLAICDIFVKGYLSNECLGYKDFYTLLNTTRRVYYPDQGTIVFQCKFLNTCEFEWQTVMQQLQQKVIPKEFAVSATDKQVICADRDFGDSICINTFSKDIWLLKKPIIDNMVF